MTDAEILDAWSARCAKARNMGQRNAPMIAAGAPTVSETVARLLAEVENRRRPVISRNGKAHPMSRAHERITRVIEFEAKWLREQVEK